MSTLAQIYSQATGLKINRPHICKKFFPLSDEKYITIQPFSKNQSAKCYDYWNEVISLLSPILKQSNIKIYQLGEKDEPILMDLTPLNGQTSICQANFIIQNSLLHLSADSFTAHSAGAMGVPQVSLYGNTDSSIHGPMWRGKAILIDSHRNGNKPSFSHEHDKSINKITPEEIVNAALTLLGASGRVERKSLFFGRVYTGTTVEWVPNTTLDLNFLKEAPIVARYDYFQNEANLFNTLSMRKLAITTKTNLSLSPIAQLKQNILGLTVIIDKDSVISKEFLSGLKSIGIKTQCVTFETDDDWISSKRLEFLDDAQIYKASHPNKTNLVKSINNYTNSLDGDTVICGDNLWFRSNKFTLSNGKIYLSHFHYINDLPTNSLENNVMPFVDNQLFFQDLEHFYVFGHSI